jgi:hypothetical protein
MAAVMDLSWLAYQRSAISSSIAIGCRAGAIMDPGYNDSDWAALEAGAEAAVLSALASTGAACDNADCTVTVTSFGTDPLRGLECTVHRDFQPLTSLILDPIEIEETIVVRMEWQR